MQIITLIISSVSLILSGYAIYRTIPSATSSPDAGTLGAGGGGHR